MSKYDLTLKVHVREHKDDGSPESTWPNLAGAEVYYQAGAAKQSPTEMAPAVTGPDGIAEVGGDAVKIFVKGPQGFESYEGVYNRPSLDGELPVSLRRV